MGEKTENQVYICLSFILKKKKPTLQVKEPQQKNGGYRYCPNVRNCVANIETDPKCDKFRQGSHYISMH